MLLLPAFWNVPCLSPPQYHTTRSYCSGQLRVFFVVKNRVELSAASFTIQQTAHSIQHTAYSTTHTAEQLLVRNHTPGGVSSHSYYRALLQMKLTTFKLIRASSAAYLGRERRICGIKSPAVSSSFPLLQSVLRYFEVYFVCIKHSPAEVL